MQAVGVRTRQERITTSFRHHARLTWYLTTIRCLFHHAKVMKSRVLQQARFFSSSSLLRTQSASTTRFTVAASRLNQVTNQFSAPSARTYTNMASSANPKMGDTSDPSKQNNELFKLENLFNVKPRVALVTGQYVLHSFSNHANNTLP